MAESHGQYDFGETDRVEELGLTASRRPFGDMPIQPTVGNSMNVESTDSGGRLAVSTAIQAPIE